jgi:WD40 repeat protein
MYTPPHNTLHMLLGETGGTRSIDFSSDGHLLVSGNVRGELVVWDVEHRRYDCTFQPMLAQQECTHTFNM